MKKQNKTIKATLEFDNMEEVMALEDALNALEKNGHCLRVLPSRHAKAIITLNDLVSSLTGNDFLKENE